MGKNYRSDLFLSGGQYIPKVCYIIEDSLRFYTYDMNLNLIDSTLIHSFVNKVYKISANKYLLFYSGLENASIYLFTLPATALAAATIERVEGFPNPVSEVFTLQGEALGKGGNLHILDMHGRVIRTIKVPPRSENIQIPVNDMSSGTYLYQIGDLVGKFVVQQKKIAIEFCGKIK